MGLTEPASVFFHYESSEIFVAAAVQIRNIILNHSSSFGTKENICSFICRQIIKLAQTHDYPCALFAS